MLRKSASIVAAVLAVLSCAAAVHAASLDRDTCNRLKTEQDGLEKAGIRAVMAKGPEWAKENLTPDKLAEVRRTIELDEQLLFRCAGKPLVVLPPEADPAASPPEPIEGGKEEGKKPAVPAEPKAPEKTPPQRKAAVSKDGVKSDAEPAKPSGEEPAAKAPAKPKPKAKPKGKEDAYKAAPPAGISNPFSFN